MRLIIKVISFAGLGLTLIPATLVYLGNIDLDTNKTLMFAGTICWFLTAPYWMNKTAKKQG